ncbi:MAG: helix-turn-helix protein [Chitinophagaceae bacterium]|nr:helix-turn-helix protein [Chitinophagaceae bacterium]
MKIDRYIPCDALKPFIKAFLLIESEQGMNNRILPDTALVMAFRLRGMVTFTDSSGEFTLPSQVITGIRKSSRIMNYAAGSATLLVLFTEAGPSAFFKAPMHHLFGQSISMEEFFCKKEIEEIEEKIYQSKTNNERFKCMEYFLTAQLKRHVLDPLVLQAIQTIKKHQGILSIYSLASLLCISQDAFEKRFRKSIGTSPKHFASIVRLKHIIATHSTSGTLAETAYDAGYFDQTHFNKDFKSFTGLTPSAFFRQEATW